MTWVGQWRARRYAGEIRAGDAEGRVPPAERRARQLERLNATWRRIVAEVPYYRELAAALGLPDAFTTLEEFVDRVPPVTRDAVQRHRDAMTSTARPPETYRITGGSTAAPVQLPAWNDETRAVRADMWVARGWYGIDPASRLFLLWGHSHLLGTGWRGWLNARRREWSDRLLGYLRFSAYDVRPEALRRAGHALLRFRPDYVVGYSVALHGLAEANADRREALRGLGLRAIIGTGEGFPSADSATRLADLFGCPVTMEYGAVETGVLAHGHPDGGYRSFWRSHLLDAEREPNGHHLLRVTSLTPRAFPLVRYELGDEVELDEPGLARAVGLDRFHRVVGRCNDYVELADGARIHSEVFSHAMRPVEGLSGFQVVQGDGGIRIRYTSWRPPSDDAREAARRRLARVHPRLADVRFEPVEELPKTVAGKTRMVLRERGS